MMNFNWLFVHFLPTAGFILAILLLAHILRERRPPTSTLAWLMSIVFIPYLGVPLYLILGGRKMNRMARAKPKLSPSASRLSHGPIFHERALFAPGDGISPPSAGNHITFMADGEQAFAAIIHMIRQARTSIYVATFILGRDETGSAIVRALGEKASQGLNVCLLLDALGSVKMNRKFLKPLLDAGGEVAFFMPMVHLPFRGRANLRNHRKMIICDNHTAVVGGMNLAAEYMGPDKSAGRWQDLSLMVRGPVVKDIADIFGSDWSFASKTTVRDDETGRQTTVGESGGVAQLVASGPDVAKDSLRNAILTAIFRAKRRVWIVTPYFVPDELMMEALCIAVDRQIDVSMVVPKKSNHRLADIVREGYLARIQEAGSRIWLYEPGMLHAKAILVDDSLAIVGSANMDMRSILLNYEIALCIDDAGLIGTVENWMDGLKVDCSERKLVSKRMFGIVEGVGRLFAPLL